MRHLFEKTIAFFEVVAQESSSLMVDLKILKGLQETLPPKDQLLFGSHAFPAPSAPPSNGSFFPNGSMSHAVQGPSPSPHANSNTPSDMGHSTPMEYERQLP